MMASNYMQRLKGRLVVNSTLEEPCSPPLSSSYNLSTELSLQDISCDSSVVASQDLRQSMLNDTEVCFNPIAYSTICQVSTDSSPEHVSSGSSPHKVSETDSEDLSAASLYVTTVEPVVTSVDETRDESLENVISGLSNMAIGAQTQKEKRAMAAAALLSSSESEDDDLTLPSSVQKSSRTEELSQRLNSILSTCKKKKPVLLRWSTDSPSSVVPETDSSSSRREGMSSEFGSILDSNLRKKILAPDSQSYEKNQTVEAKDSELSVVQESEEQTNDACLQVSLQSEDDFVNVRNVSLQVSLLSECDLSKEMHTPPSISRFSSAEDEFCGNSIENRISDHNNNTNNEYSEDNDSHDNCFDVGEIKAAFKKLTFSSAESSDSEREQISTARRKKRLQMVLADDTSVVDLPPSLPSMQSSNRVPSDSSSDDEFENYIQLQKKKKSETARAAKSPQSLKSFIVDDLSSEDDNDSVFHTLADRVFNSRPQFKTPHRHIIVEEDCGVMTEIPKNPSVRKKHPSTPRPLALPDITNVGSPQRSSPLKRLGFLASLSANVSDIRRHPDSLKYLKKFSSVREELSGRLFKLYNETVFAKELPENMEVKWNVRLTKTAGFCTYKRQMPTATGRWAKIELSVKVCDSAERLRDTMIHEMCHAAVWLINGENDHHGPLWQLYARKANRVHEELAPISRCHSYEIQTKYTYKCNKCGYEIGRHSKSLDTAKKICGYCQGTFEAFINTPRRTPKRATANRTPNPFALFVKENYAVLKQRHASLSHRDIMKKLGEDFKK